MDRVHTLGPIQQLYADLRYVILDVLEPVDLARMATTCRSWRVTLSRDRPWHRLCRHFYGRRTLSRTTWRQTCETLHRSWTDHVRTFGRAIGTVWFAVQNDCLAMGLRAVNTLTSADLARAFWVQDGMRTLLDMLCESERVVAAAVMYRALLARRCPPLVVPLSYERLMRAAYAQQARIVRMDLERGVPLELGPPYRFHSTALESAIAGAHRLTQTRDHHVSAYDEAAYRDLVFMLASGGDGLSITRLATVLNQAATLDEVAFAQILTVVLDRFHVADFVLEAASQKAHEARRFVNSALLQEHVEEEQVAAAQ